jgi:hypothetical protein
MPITIGGKNPTKFEAPSGPVFRRKPTVPGVVSGLAEMALGAGFLVTWFKPDLLGQEWVLLALELMLLEFILVHSAAFMGMKGTGTSPAMTRLKWFGGIGAFYSLFVLGFCLSLDSWRPMASFWIITMQRLMGDVYEPKPSAESKVWFTTSIAMNAMLYLLLVMAFTVLPVPRFGVTGSLSSWISSKGGGLWVDEPQRVVAIAAFYYLLRGWATAEAWPRTGWQVEKAQRTNAG